MTPWTAFQADAGITGAIKSPTVSTVLRSVSCGELDLLLSLDVTRASGLPRLVIRSGSPVRATSSSNARHHALNVEIATDFMVIEVDHIGVHGTTECASPRW
jgi:hypothetical protein